MKTTIAVAALCTSLGLAVGAAWAGSPPPAAQKAPAPQLTGALASIEHALQQVADAPPDTTGHLKKAADLLRKATDELREAMGMGHKAHSHDKE